MAARETREGLRHRRRGSYARLENTKKPSYKQRKHDNRGDTRFLTPRIPRDRGKRRQREAESLQAARRWRGTQFPEQGNFKKFKSFKDSKFSISRPRQALRGQGSRLGRAEGGKPKTGIAGSSLEHLVTAPVFRDTRGSSTRRAICRYSDAS